MVQDLIGATTDEPIPQVFGFNRRRTSITVDVSEAFRRPRNGLQVHVALNSGTAREGRFQQWISKAGSAATRPEFMVFEALNRLGLRGPFEWLMPVGLDFDYQVALLGGRSEEGGAVADFVIYAVAPNIVIRVQGEFFHFGDDPTRKSDIIQKLLLESAGFKVIDIVAQDTLTEGRVNEVTAYALIGLQVDFTGRIGVFT